MEHAELSPALLADCHHLGRLPASELLLQRNASLPWFILVPDTQLSDVLDLPEEHLHAVLSECTAVSVFIKQELGFEKVNFAGLGNVVPDMHLHIIGRRVGDPCWPRPVWGNLPDGGEYATGQLQEWQAALVKMIGLNATPLSL
jgi:diadenosine tetraphosphate (Ap4A) HIT family hydrolase